jgi:hypothetical protein
MDQATAGSVADDNIDSKQMHHENISEIFITPSGSHINVSTK